MRKSKPEIYLEALTQLLAYLDKHKVFTVALLAFFCYKISLDYAEELAIIIEAFK